jgi:hypothetical protein
LDEYTVKIKGYRRSYIMERWEYQSIKFETEGFLGGILDIENFDSEINRLGEKGWELISCFTTNKGQGESREVIAVFKRIK